MSDPKTMLNAMHHAAWGALALHREGDDCSFQSREYLDKMEAFRTIRWQKLLSQPAVEMLMKAALQMERTMQIVNAESRQTDISRRTRFRDLNPEIAELLRACDSLTSDRELTEQEVDTDDLNRRLDLAEYSFPGKQKEIFAKLRDMKPHTVNHVACQDQTDEAALKMMGRMANALLTNTELRLELDINGSSALLKELPVRQI